MAAAQHVPAGIEDAPVIEALARHLIVAGHKELLCQDAAALAGPRCPVWVLLVGSCHHHHQKPHCFTPCCCPHDNQPPRVPPRYTHPYSAGVPCGRAVHLRAEQADSPRVAEELGGGFQHALLAGQVILRVAVEVPAQPHHAAPVLRLQPDVHPRACTTPVLGEPGAVPALGAASPRGCHIPKSHLRPTAPPVPGGTAAAGRCRRAAASARSRCTLWGGAPRPHSPSHPFLQAAGP